MSLSFSGARTAEIQNLDSPVMLTKNNPIWAENIPNDKPWLIKKQKKQKSLCYWICLLEPNSILRGLHISRAHHAGSLKWPDYNSLLSCALIRVFWPIFYKRHLQTICARMPYFPLCFALTIQTLRGFPRICVNMTLPTTICCHMNKTQAMHGWMSLTNITLMLKFSSHLLKKMFVKVTNISLM